MDIQSAKQLYYIKPNSFIYVLHNRHGQLLHVHCFIAFLNIIKDCEFLIYGGTRFHNCELLQVTVSVP